MSRFDLTEEVRAKYIPVISKFFDEIASKTTEDLEAMEDDDFVLPLSDTELNPYTLQKILETDFGYEVDCADTNGWEMDFWVNLLKDNVEDLTNSICIEGQGITFELNLKVYVK